MRIVRLPSAVAPPATVVDSSRGIFLVESGAAPSHLVELGLRSDTHVEIAGDVRPGQLVITGPYKILRDLQGGDLVDVEAPARQGRTP
ncbi:MAG: hypothetical protein R3E12_06105 [Candidatus Eisenbacteria bacterium]